MDIQVIICGPNAGNGLDLEEENPNASGAINAVKRVGGAINGVKRVAAANAVVAVVVFACTAGGAGAAENNIPV